MSHAYDRSGEHGEELAAIAQAATRLRRDVIRMTSEAGSGHPTSCLSAADLVASLFSHALRYDVANPANPQNDRFVLSKGHTAPLLYAAWAEAGAIPVEKLLTLRRLDSELEGHPTPRFPWVDVATGSLGQGLSAGAGMALAARLDGLDFRVYVLMGDGEVAEGAVWEAAEVTAYHRLDHLIGIIDVNRLGQSGPTMLEHDLATYRERFAAFGWHTITIDGHDVSAIVHALDEAAAVTGRPTVIVARTIKGKGVSFLEDKEGWHGKALARDGEMERALDELRLDGPETPLRVHAPAERVPATTVPSAASIDPPDYAPGQQEATRAAFGAALAKLGGVEPRLVVLDGDVKDSTRTADFFAAFPRRAIEGYIAEQNLVGLALGLQARGKIPFVATFAAFLTRAFDQIRMAGISRANMKLAGSHVGVSIGQDGPSQMGLEDLAMMRAIPGSTVLYPCDAVSAERMVELAVRTPGIVYIRTTRPKTPIVYGAHDHFTVGGCKVLRADAKDRLTVVAAGITVHEALRARDELLAAGVPIRVIDCYSVKPLDTATLLTNAVATKRTVLTVEDHYPAGGLGEAVASALTPEGVRVRCLAVGDVPRSGAPEELLALYGIDAHAIVAAVRVLYPERPRRGIIRRRSGRR